ncbi:MAG TPA: hypothetical protein DHW82_09565 [Spirochaetia bacterium]|nr:MAG: hypothetical protein A2Y41_01965 [Spirochaetes bacterium GWB1_36_13]HCL57238.1 hypothetical protein [Spirochaetia bacterium]
MEKIRQSEKNLLLPGYNKKNKKEKPMKKILTLLFTLIISSSLFAVKKADTIEAGVMLGIGIFQYQINNTLIDNEYAATKMDVSAKSSFSFGIDGAYYLSPELSLTLGIGYLSKSVAVDRTWTTEKVETTASFGFLGFYPGAKYYFMDIFYAGGGLFAGLPVSKPSILSKAGTSDYVKAEFGLWGEFGVSLPIDETIDAFGGIRLNIAFNKIYNNDKLRTSISGSNNINDSSLENLNSQLFQIVFGATYRIDLFN